MVWPLLKAQVVSVGVSLLAPFAHHPLSTVAWHLGEYLSWGSIIGFGVLGAWNLLSPDTEGRAERLEAAREHQLMIMEHASPRVRTERWDDAIREAQRAGTLSINGVRQPRPAVRYAGPPPVYTPPRGIEVVITVELSAQARVGRPQEGPVVLHRDATWVFPRPGDVTPVTSSECDECGEPMDVAWVEPGTVRTCRPCRAHGMASYLGPQPHYGRCGGCGDRVACTRGEPGHGHFCFYCAYSK